MEESSSVIIWNMTADRFMEQTPFSYRKMEMRANIEFNYPGLFEIHAMHVLDNVTSTDHLPAHYVGLLIVQINGRVCYP